MTEEQRCQEGRSANRMQRGVQHGLISRCLLIVYLLETGLLLVIAPWSTLWDRNLLLAWFPLLGGIAQLTVVRGAVSGVGIVNLWAGAWELFAWIRATARRARPESNAARQSPRIRSDTPGSEETRPWAQHR